MLTVSDISAKGVAVGTLTTFRSRGCRHLRSRRRRRQIKQLTAVNEDILAGREARRGQGDLVHLGRRDEDSGLVHHAARLRSVRKYPLQLHIHGGPHSMYGVGFNFGWQEHAANDYVILYTNPRGSTGYGSAFGNAIKNAYPGKDFDDLMAGVDAVLAKGFVDPQNLFVTGCSGGGVLTAWTVGHTDRSRLPRPTARSSTGSASSARPTAPAGTTTSRSCRGKTRASTSSAHR